MALPVSRAALARVHAHAEAAWPDEAVGVLAGRAGRVLQAAPLRNERAGPGFHVGGLALMAAETALTDAGHDILGYYHSHPEHPARPSCRDREHAWPGACWLIVSVRGGRVTDTRAWRLRPDRSAMDPLPISTTDED